MKNNIYKPLITAVSLVIGWILISAVSQAQPAGCFSPGDPCQPIHKGGPAASHCPLACMPTHGSEDGQTQAAAFESEGRAERGDCCADAPCGGAGQTRYLPPSTPNAQGALEPHHCLASIALVHRHRLSALITAGHFQATPIYLHISALLC